MGKVIAIDGPSGAGKSTVAKLLAEKLGFTYLDTGALYRAAALLLLENGIKPDDTDEVLLKALGSSSIMFDNGRIILNNRDVSADIRTPEAGHFSSVFSARKVVRKFLLGAQRQMAVSNNLVVEGRDTTTVVFPEAWKKFYMDASVPVRANRRYSQLNTMGIAVTYEEAERDVIERDRRDQGRDIAPLKKADDAVAIDTTEKSLEQVVENIMEVIRTDS